MAKKSKSDMVFTSGGKETMRLPSKGVASRAGTVAPKIKLEVRGAFQAKPKRKPKSR